MAKTSICKGCGRLIRWIRTPAGKAMPCDPEPVLYWRAVDGGHKIVTPGGEVVTASLEGPLDRATGRGYISHFATCAQAETFRR